MKRFIKSFVATAMLASFTSTTLFASASAQAHGSEASALSIAIPVVVVAAVSVAGATLVVKSVEASATGVVCVLERASDGARVSLEFAGRSAATLGMSVGVTASVVMTASGAIITSAGEAIAFIPNAMGRALTHNERM
jgi:hypothetical protein